MVEEGALSAFVRKDPQRRYYKISWVRWRLRQRWSAWHFQPRIPDQSLACGDGGPAGGSEVELARGVMADLRRPEPPVCRVCERAARRLFAGLR